MKVTMIMNNEFGLPVARKIHLLELGEKPAYVNGPLQLLVTCKYKGKRKPSAFRKSAGKVYFIEGWYDAPESAFNAVIKKDEYDAFDNDMPARMLSEIANAKVIAYWDGMELDATGLPQEIVTAECIVKGPKKDALAKAKANPNSLLNMINNRL